MRPVTRVVVVAAAVTAAAYLALFAWDQETTFTGPDGGLRVPYEPWQVGVLALAVGAVAVWAGWRGRPVKGSLAAAVALTACWGVDNIPGAEDRLMLVGAGLVAVGTFVATVVVGGIASEVRRGRRP